MALSKNVLGDLIYDKIHATFKTPKKGRASLRKLSDALADAIVTHITAAATVNVTVAVTTDTTVQTTDSGLQRDPVGPFTDTLGPSVAKNLAGTGTGTGTGTIT